MWSLKDNKYLEQSYLQQGVDVQAFMDHIEIITSSYEELAWIVSKLTDVGCVCSLNIPGWSTAV